MMSSFYGEDLAAIHAAAFGGLGEAAAGEVLRHLGDDARGAVVVDIGCGAGALAAPLLDAGARIWGADLSPELIEVARARAPSGTFVVGSIYDLDPPPAAAVCCIGEVVNYLADDRAGLEALTRFVARAASSLPRGGLLLFDAAAPGRGGGGTKSFTEGDGWAVGAVSEEHDGRLTRRITTFRHTSDGCWRRTHEIHRLQLLAQADVSSILKEAGFTVSVSGAYGALQLPSGLIAYAAVKQ